MLATAIALVVAAGAVVIAMMARGPEGDASPSGFRRVQALAREFASRPVAGKLEFRLAPLATLARGGKPRVALARARSGHLEVKGRRVWVILEAAPGGRAAVDRRIRSLGGHVEGRYAHLTLALVPPAVLPSLARGQHVRFVRPPISSSADGPITGEGVSVTNADAWHRRGYTGEGVTVAVIDVGFEGYADLVGSELPEQVTARDFCYGRLTTAGRHGTSVAEIVHEVAPNARLLLLCVGNEVQLGEAYDYAKRQGTHIVTHSVSWYTEGRGDGSGDDGTPAAIVAAARKAGILWVNSAGNRAAREHWHGTFTDSDGDGFHNFSEDDNSNSVEVSGDGSSEAQCFTLKWDDWPRSSENYDLILTHGETGAIVDRSVNPQTGVERPTEEICHAGHGTFDIKIARVSGTRAVRLDLFSWGRRGSSLQFFKSAGSLTEPGSSSNTIAVGAICWKDDALQAYSSRGPTIDGRTKPDISAPTNVSGLAAGMFRSCGAGGFGGTSAATPHVAGVAALVKERFPRSTPAQLQSYLERNAVDLGPPGKDNGTGSGKLVLPAP